MKKDDEIVKTIVNLEMTENERSKHSSTDIAMIMMGM